MAALSMSPIRGYEGVEKVYGAQLQPPQTPQEGISKKNISPSRDVQKGWGSNQTASYVPDALRDCSAEFIGMRAVHRRIQECLAAIAKAKDADTKQRLEQELEYMQRIPPAEPILIDLSVRVTDQLMKLLADDIQDNAETKFQLFVTQALLVYKTNRVYALHDTKDQSGQGKKFYPAAHCGVIPSLKYKEGEVWFDLARGTIFGKIFNITTVFPKAVNLLDICIDGRNGATNRLRYFSLKLLNELAEAKTTDLKKSFMEFLILFLDQLKRAHTYYTDKNEPHQLLALTCYKTVAESYQEKLKTNDSLLKTMCFVKDYKVLTLDKCIEIAQKEMQSRLIRYQARTIDERFIASEPTPPVTRAASKAIASNVKLEQQKTKTAAQGVVQTIQKPKEENLKFNYPPAASAASMPLAQVSSKEQASKKKTAEILVNNVTHLSIPYGSPPNTVAKNTPVGRGKLPRAIEYQNFLETSDDIKQLAAKYFSSKKLQDKVQIEKKAKEIIMKEYRITRSPNGLSEIVDKALRAIQNLQKGTPKLAFAPAESTAPMYLRLVSSKEKAAEILVNHVTHLSIPYASLPNTVVKPTSVGRGKLPRAIEYQNFLETSDDIKQLAVKYFPLKKLQDKEQIEKKAKEIIMKKYHITRSPNGLSEIVDKALKTIQKAAYGL